MPGVEWQSVIADRRTLLFAGLCTIVVGLCAGIVPVARASRHDLTSALKVGGRDGHGQRSPLATALVLTQVTLSVMLLIGAGLFVRSVQRVARLDLGYDVDRLVVVDLRLRGTSIDSAARLALRRALIERAEQNPNVESVTLACSVPFSGTCAPPIFVVGIDSTNRLGEFVKQLASPAYFHTTGTRILRGRGILNDDRAGAPWIAVVSEAMARALWPNEDAIGKCFKMGSDTAPCRTVVGIAENVKQEQVGDDEGLQYYIPVVQDADRSPRLLVRVRGEAREQSNALLRDLTSVVPASGYLVVRPMSQIVDNVTRSWRLGAVMFVAFGALAIVVAGVGLYSVIAYDVAQRKHEVGVRIALGARVADIITLVVGNGVRVVIAGIALGACLTLLVGRWVGPLLFHVSPRDPLVFALVALVLVGVSLAASMIPALHASRVDPATSLRSD
jgi:predicted permease